MNTKLLWQGLEVAGLGLAGVFGALITFYIIVILLGMIPEKKSDS